MDITVYLLLDFDISIASVSTILSKGNVTESSHSFTRSRLFNSTSSYMKLINGCYAPGEILA